MPTGRFKVGTGPVAQPADLVIEQVKSCWPDEPIRIRLQPQVYYPTPGHKKRNGMFMAWRGLYWNWTCDTVEDARGLRQVLTRAIALVSTVGPDEVLRRLALDTPNGMVVESAVTELNAQTNTVS